LLVAAALLMPIYRARNTRWVELAELSERVLDRLAADVGSRPTGHIVLVDAPAERFNLAAAFGNLFPEAVQLRVGDGWTGELVSAPNEASGPADLIYRLSAGALERVPAR